MNAHLQEERGSNGAGRERHKHRQRHRQRCKGVERLGLVKALTVARNSHRQASSGSLVRPCMAEAAPAARCVKSPRPTAQAA